MHALITKFVLPLHQPRGGGARVLSLRSYPFRNNLTGVFIII